MLQQQDASYHVVEMYLLKHKEQSTSPSSYWYVIAGEAAPLAPGAEPGWPPSFLFPNGFFEYVHKSQGETQKCDLPKTQIEAN